MIILIASIFFIFLAVPFFRYPKLLDDGLYCLVGKKRSGKTTFLASTSIYYYLRNRPVYSTCPLPCAKLISKDDIGIIHFPPYSIILIDEIGLLFNNRNFKTFPEHVTTYFKMQGHYKHLVIVASQAFDFDKKIRDLVDMVGLIDKFRFSLTRIRWAVRVLEFDKNVDDEHTGIIESFKPQFLIGGGWHLLYRPIYYPFFDSFEAPVLKEKKYKVPVGMKHKFQRKKYPPLVAFWTYRFRLSKAFKLLSRKKSAETPQSEPVADVLALPDTQFTETLSASPTAEKPPFRLNILSDVDSAK